jgi:hypothetical protein
MTVTKKPASPARARTPATAAPAANAPATKRTAQRATKAATAAKATKTPTPRKSPSAPEVPLLTQQQVMEVLGLAKQSHSVELKLSVPDTSHRAAIKGLGLDPVEAEPRQAYFFDTPGLALSRAGVVVRARRIKGGRADTVIKLRPVDPATIDPELRHSASFKIEVDVMPGGFVCSASFKGACTNQEVLDVTSGKAPLSSLFSKGQRAFFEAHAPAGIGMDALATLGPTFLLKSRHQPKDFDRRVTVEMWLYPDGSRILEVSTKTLPDESFQVGAEFKAYLVRCGIALDAPQQTKTKTALEFFAKQLAAEQRKR